MRRVGAEVRRLPRMKVVERLAVNGAAKNISMTLKNMQNDR